MARACVRAAAARGCARAPPGRGVRPHPTDGGARRVLLHACPCGVCCRTPAARVAAVWCHVRGAAPDVVLAQDVAAETPLRGRPSCQTKSE